MADVLLRNVIKRYGNYEAVRGISLEIPDSKFVALVGPSGCGKTTTLRMIAGLEDVSEGDICIGGRVINDVAPKNRDIAMVFQSYALYPHMTVFQNMAFRPAHAGHGEGRDSAWKTPHAFSIFRNCSAGGRKRFPAASASVSYGPRHRPQSKSVPCSTSR